MLLAMGEREEGWEECILPVLIVSAFHFSLHSPASRLILGVLNSTSMLGPFTFCLLLCLSTSLSNPFCLALQQPTALSNRDPLHTAKRNAVFSMSEPEFLPVSAGEECLQSKYCESWWMNCPAQACKPLYYFSVFSYINWTLPSLRLI